jgi:hypothetical protein
MNRCPYCSRPLELVRVHGHDQCRHCGVNVHPCCNGEQCESWGVQEKKPEADGSKAAGDAQESLR